MAVCRKYYNNIYAWIIAVVMCVSYFGVCGLYNPNIRNYSAHTMSSLGESRGIDAGNNDMLMVDNSVATLAQTGNLRTRDSEKSIDDTWMLSSVLATLLLSLILFVCTFAGIYRQTMSSHRWILLEYIHKKDGKKRAFID